MQTYLLDVDKIASDFRGKTEGEVKEHIGALVGNLHLPSTIKESIVAKLTDKFYELARMFGERELAKLPTPEVK